MKINRLAQSKSGSTGIWTVALACVAIGWAPMAFSQTVSLSFTPSTVARGQLSVLAATAANGTEPYAHTFQWRWAGVSNWTTARFTAPTVTNAWTSSIDFRVRVVDATQATSAWSDVSTLTVLQPVASLAFNPSTVTQSQESVLTAEITNGTAPYTYTYQYRWGGTGTWKNSGLVAPSLTNAFKSSIEYRVRTVDANNITSGWATALLTVMPSEITAGLSFDPTEVIRGSNATLTATAEKGYGNYRYTYQWRWHGASSWTTAGFTTPTTTYAWASSIDFRVRAVDDFNSTSAWSDVATLTVVQPQAMLAFNPSSVAQSQESVLSASVTNGTPPYSLTYQWRWAGGTTWLSSSIVDAETTNKWKASIEYRVKSEDANGVTSAWSEAAALTVLPSEIASSLSFSPTLVRRGSNATLTATATNGTDPYAYSYQWRWGGDEQLEQRGVHDGGDDVQLAVEHRIPGEGGGQLQFDERMERGGGADGPAAAGDGGVRAGDGYAGAVERGQRGGDEHVRRRGFPMAAEDGGRMGERDERRQFHRGHLAGNG